MNNNKKENYEKGKTTKVKEDEVRRCTRRATPTTTAKKVKTEEEKKTLNKRKTKEKQLKLIKWKMR